MKGLIDRLSAQDRTNLLASGMHKRVEAGEIIYQEGDHAAYLYIIQDGAIGVYNRIAPNRTITMYMRHSRDGFGELGILSGTSQPHSARAVKGSQLLMIHKQDLYQLLQKNASLCLTFIQWLADSQAIALAKLRDYVSFGAREAVASVFMRYANMYGSVMDQGIQITVPIQLNDIGKYVGVSRETVSRIVSKWKEQEVMRSDGRYYVIQNKSFFEAMLACHACSIQHCIL